MAYSGAHTARQARENLGRALAALQEDPNIPPDVLAVAQNIAGAVGALFEAERASSEPDGKASVKSALGSVSQTLALLQEVKGQHRGVQQATEAIAQTLSLLFPLSTQPSRMPPPGYASPAAVPHAAPVPHVAAGPNIVGQPMPGAMDGGPTLRDQQVPAAAHGGSGRTGPMPAPQQQQWAPQAPPQQGFSPPHAHSPGPQGGFSPPAAQPGKPVAPASQYRDNRAREQLEVNIGATTESNFFVGFSGEISEGGVFAATYNILPKGAGVRVLVTLPGGFEKEVLGTVRFVRDPMDMSAESEPGMGIQFESLDHEARELILRFIRKRPPMFYDE